MVGCRHRAFVTVHGLGTSSFFGPFRAEKCACPLPALWAEGRARQPGLGFARNPFAELLGSLAKHELSPSTFTPQERRHRPTPFWVAAADRRLAAATGWPWPAGPFASASWAAPRLVSHRARWYSEHDFGQRPGVARSSPGEELWALAVSEFASGASLGCQSDGAGDIRDAKEAMTCNRSRAGDWLIFRAVSGRKMCLSPSRPRGQSP